MHAYLGWLEHGNLFLEAEVLICAIQDQVIATRSYRRYIINDNSADNVNCRLCGEVNDTMNTLWMIVGTADRNYTNRRNNADRIIHRELFLQYVLENDKCFV